MPYLVTMNNENQIINSMESEVWKPVVGYEGLYEVSNIGRVKVLFGSMNTKLHSII